MRPRAMLGAREAPGAQRQLGLEVGHRPDAPELARREFVRRLELEGSRRHAARAATQPREATHDPPSRPVEAAPPLKTVGGGPRWPGGGAGAAQAVQCEAEGESVDDHGRASTPVRDAMR